MMHKVINADVPCWFHLDIKMDVSSGELLPFMLPVYEAAVETWVTAFGIHESLEMDEGVVKAVAGRVVREYFALCEGHQPMEGECMAGVEIMTGFVRGHLEEHIPGIEERVVKLWVVMGCQPAKFSIHMVEEQLFFDSNMALLPIFVFFLCRKFSWFNLREVVKAPRDLPEGGEMADGLKFRLRALRLEKAVVVNYDIGCTVDYVNGVAVERVRREGDSDFKVSGYNDTPMDEVVYTKNHYVSTLRACV
jgi:hypothetical protein